MINITDSAKKYLDEVRNDDHVTLGVKGGGCSGFTYVWDFKKNWPDVNWSGFRPDGRNVCLWLYDRLCK